MDEKKKYFKPSKAQQWANEATGNFFRGAANAADKLAGGAGGRMIGRSLAGYAGRIADDAQANTVARQVRRKELPYGDQAQKLDQFKQRVENNRYGSKAPAKQIAKQTNNPIIHNTKPLDSGIISGASNNANSTGYGPGNIRFDNSSFNKDGTLTRETQDKAFLIRGRDNARSRIAGNRGVQSAVSLGNMDVRFDPSVSQAARQRFLAQPTAPGTRRVAGIGMVRGPERPQERKPPETIGEMMHERWRMANERQAESRRNNMTDQALRGRALDQQFTSDQARIGLEGGRIGLESQRVASENALRDQQMREGQLSLGRSELISNLQQRYLNPSTPDTEKQQIADQLRFLSGDKTEYKPITIDQYDDKGFQTGQQVLAFDPSNPSRTVAVTGGGQQVAAPQKAIELLMSNPKKYSESFFEKYGYLPPGI